VTTFPPIGRFRLLRRLGGGGSGLVFLAFDPVLRREVAVKVPRLAGLLTPELRRRFLLEARAAAGLDHPNLVPVHEAGEDGGLHRLRRARTLVAGGPADPPPEDAATLVPVTDATLTDGGLSLPSVAFACFAG
jgi:serine/threonine protein kinase